ncbi:hypothetical protein [Lacticaseibacillus rhamnosus]|uniref:hypothetical protein n=1 Tax=Lacticaseibacillus rhamnosus TaxID=47715 RepID=UPI00237F2259|nr:hypothetical protein [Lacticaseibacillus rhamnosus]MDE3295922.1 hypothetical protein [Lacticaseibacillus rhamnosus]
MKDKKKRALFWGKILLTIGAVMIVSLSIIFNQFSFPWAVSLFLTVVLVWYFEPSAVQSAIVDIKEGKLTVNRLHDETVQAAKDVAVTAGQFSETVDAFLAFNLADFQTQGRLGAAVSWLQGANFVNQAVALQQTSEPSDPEITILIAQAKRKVLELFQDEAERNYFSGKTLDPYIDSGGDFSDGKMRYDLSQDRAVVNFTALSKLGETLPDDQNTKWQVELQRLKKFYDRNFPDA